MRASILLCLLVAVVCVTSMETEAKRPFTCLFLPGVGVDWPELDVEEKDRASHPKFLREEFPDYWGTDLTHDLKGSCEKLYFYDTDTSYRPWNEASLQREFSRVIQKTKPHVVFAHGSANLVLSACAHSKQKGCTRLGDKTTWYGIQAPLKGTDAPRVMKKLCPKLVADPVFKGGVDCVEVPAKNKPQPQAQGKAPAQNGAGRPAPPPPPSAPAQNKPQDNKPKKYQLSDAWKQLVPSEVPKWVHKTAVEKMSGSMCGVVPTDYSKPRSEVEKSAFASIAAALSAKKPKGKRHDSVDDWKARNRMSRGRVPRAGNDGIVSFGSCRIRSHNEYSKQPNAKHYVVDGDYDFGTCANGQDRGSGNREPCSWIANMVKRAREKKGYEGKGKGNGKARFAQVVDEDEEEAEDEDEEVNEQEDEAEAEDEQEDEVEEEEEEVADQ